MHTRQNQSGTPTLSHRMDFEKIVGDDERQEWRRKVRGLEIVQVGTNKYSWTRKGFSHDKVRALCEELRHRFGEEFSSGITSYKFEDDLQDCMRDVGIDEPTTEHYNNLKSIETFENESVGLVAGCISPDAEQIKDWLALLGKDATPRREVDEEYKGQQWVGPDADVALELLRDVRERKILQACGRYARNPDDPDSGATVYVLTNQVPGEYVNRSVADIQVLGDKQRNILTHIRERDGVSVYELRNLENIESTEQHIHGTMDICAEQEWMDMDEETDRPYSRRVFYADRVPLGIVEL